MGALSPDGAQAMNQGWLARLQLGFSRGGEKTLLSRRKREGPLTLQRPFYPEEGVCHTYLLHPPGGVVGGDRLEIDVSVDDEAHALVTTPGAGKFYRSAGDCARIRQRLIVADGGGLEWFPQENIFFPGASVDMQTRVELAGQARLALWEIHCFGRPSLQERFHGELDGGLLLYREHQPRLLERLRVDARAVGQDAVLRNCPVTGTLLLSPADGQMLELARQHLPDDKHSAATLIDDLLVIRYLGASTAQARSLFTLIWRTLRPAIFGREAVLPRIWAT